MLGENTTKKDSLMDYPKNSSVKDNSNLPVRYEAGILCFGSYRKTNKLITALYMVTDIMDRDEPLRNKLRNLGAGIISDINYINLLSDINDKSLAILEAKINETMSFLEISNAVSLISEMNHSILKKEFLILVEAVREHRSAVVVIEEKSPTWLADFLEEDDKPLFTKMGMIDHHSNEHIPHESFSADRLKGHPIGHQKTTRIGLQKGSTLLKALKEIKVSDKNISNGHKVFHGTPAQYEAVGFRSGFDALKKQRREEILKIIKNYKDLNKGREGVYSEHSRGATIKDIKDGAFGILKTCGEKTLQRELFAMVSDGVLERFGEKRWSRYSIKN